jgi:hypothetical protein
MTADGWSHFELVKLSLKLARTSAQHVFGNACHQA